jgi:hypothetical protein
VSRSKTPEAPATGQAAAAPASSDDREVVKWYTRARKFPQLIGRTPDGMKIPGGPYTFTQVIGAGAVLVIGLKTMRWWATHGFLGNAVILIGATYATLLVLGRIPVGARSPLSVCAGALRAVTSPRWGRLGGRPVRLRRPHLVSHRVVVVDHPAPVRAPLPPPIPAAAGMSVRRADRAPTVQAAVASIPPRRELTGVQLLLARTSSGPNHRED